MDKSKDYWRNIAVYENELYVKKLIREGAQPEDVEDVWIYGGKRPSNYDDISAMWARKMREPTIRTARQERRRCKYEEEMFEYLTEIYPECELIRNRSVGSECTETNTHRYPDVQMWSNNFLIVFECDENAHRGKDYDCDYRRMNEVAISVGSPVWFIRWNPHGNAPIEEIESVVSSITTMCVEEIDWKYYQFNVTYIGYSERDRIRNDRRMIIATTNTKLVL